MTLVSNADFEVIDIDPVANKEEWLKIRRSGVGASVVGALMGWNPYKTADEAIEEMIADKPFEENAHTWRGTVMEDAIIKKANELRITPRPITGGQVMLRSKRIPWAMCTLDAYMVDPSGVVDVKCPTAYALKKWMVEPPKYYVAQLWWQQLVTGFDHGGLLAYFSDGEWPKYFPVERDDLEIARMVHVIEPLFQHVLESREG